MLSYGIWGLFAAVSLAHLAGCWTGNGKLCAATKPALMLLLALCCAVWAPPPLRLWLTGALLASWLGDVLLMPHGNGWFTAGGVSFLIAHVLFALVYARQIRFGDIPLAAALPAAAAYIAATAAVMRRIRPGAPPGMRIPLACYLLCNTAMNLFAFAQLVTRTGPGSLSAYLGAALFFVSDCVLFLVRFDGQRNRIGRPSFVIMLTYILGEAMITAGMIMIYRGGM